MRIFWSVLLLCILFQTVGTTAEPAGTDEFLVEAGPVWNDRHAQQRCPEALEEWRRDNGGAEAHWTGHWWTTVPNEMSVCVCRPGPAADGTADGGESRDARLRIVNLSPLEIVRPSIHVQTPEGVHSDGFITNTLPGCHVDIVLDPVLALSRLDLDMGLARFVFDDLSTLNGTATYTLAVALDDNNPFLLGKTDGGKIRVAGRMEPLFPGLDDKKEIDFTDLLNARNMAEARGITDGGAVDEEGVLIMPVRMGGSLWLTHVMPAADGTAYDAKTTRVAAMIMRTDYRDWVAQDALGALYELDLRPWFAQIRDGSDPESELRPLEAITFSTFEKDREKARELVAKVLTDDKPDEEASDILVVLVGEETYRQAATGGDIAAAPGYLLRVSNSLMLEINYMADCSGLVAGTR